MTKRLIYFFTIPFLLIGCGTSSGKVGTIDDFNYSPTPLLVECNTGKIKVASLEDLSDGEIGFLEGVSKGITTRFVNPKEWNENGEISQSAFDNKVGAACKE